MNDKPVNDTRIASHHTIDDTTLNRIEKNLNKYSFFSLVRHLEKQLQHDSGFFLVGEASSPNSDIIDIVQSPSLTFCFTNINSIDLRNDKVIIDINEVGLLGTNSPLPSHLIEYIYERKHQYGDKAWADFVNKLQQRLLTTFYRSWRNAQSIASIENKKTDRFSKYIASLTGLLELEREHQNKSVDYYSKLYFSGAYLNRNWSKDGLESILNEYFGVNICVLENKGRWIVLNDREKTSLNKQSIYNLGDGLIIGRKIYDSQTSIRIVVGPMTLKQCETFFRNKLNAKKLSEWLHLYLGEEYDWDVQLILQKESVPKLGLDGSVILGMTSYLGNVETDVDDIILKY